MPLTPGARLGPYEILSQAGSGGMGEVYRARDTRLDRTVAIKILAPELAGDENVRGRFEREARAIATLDHPHICGIYDVGESSGTHFLVMPHLDGQTLAARLANGPVPVDQALKIATEIADALDKAHRQGIVHRDLKPGNVMLTRTGAKLLDFGLAKFRGPAGPISMSGQTAFATSLPSTGQGAILGTVQYMSPEQVEGKDADARSDIWALGQLGSDDRIRRLGLAAVRRPQANARRSNASERDARAPVAGQQWNRDGSELFYLSSSLQLMSASIAGGPVFVAGVPKALFEARVPLTGNPYRTTYNVTADGKRFLVNTIPEGSTSPPITVVLNWQEELKQRVPTR